MQFHFSLLATCAAQPMLDIVKSKLKNDETSRFVTTYTLTKIIENYVVYRLLYSANKNFLLLPIPSYFYDKCETCSVSDVILYVKYNVSVVLTVLQSVLLVTHTSRQAATVSKKKLS
jgi:hypothetical protein